MLLNELLLGQSGVHHTRDPFRIDEQISIRMLKRTMLLAASLLIFLVTITVYMEPASSLAHEIIVKYQVAVNLKSTAAACRG